MHECSESVGEQRRVLYRNYHHSTKQSGSEVRWFLHWYLFWICSWMTPRCSLHHRTNHWESLIWHQPLMTRQTPLVRGRWLYLSSVQLDLILMPLHSTLVLSKATTYLSCVDLLPQHQVTYCFPNTSYLLFLQHQVTYCSPKTKLLFPQYQVTVPPTPS